MFSLALVVDGVPTVGVGYEPMTDRLYWAVCGHGAFCNGTRLHVNHQTLAEGIFAASCSYANIRRHKYYDKLIERKVSTASISGAVAKSVRVAEGRFVGYYAEKVNAYDMAAVHVIVEEAGGKGSIYVNPTENTAQEIRQAIEQLLASPERIQQMREVGYSYVQKFTDENVCENLLKVYQKVIS